MLVLARLIFLVRDREQATIREQTLREASARFAVAPDREAAYGAAMEAVERLAVGRHRPARRPRGRGPRGPADPPRRRVPGRRGGRPRPPRGSRPRAGRGPRTARRRRPRDPAGRRCDGDHAPGPLLVIPLASQRSVRTALLVSTDNAAPRHHPAGHRHPVDHAVARPRGGRAVREPAPGPERAPLPHPGRELVRPRARGRRRPAHHLRERGQPAPPRPGRGRADGHRPVRAPPRRGPPDGRVDHRPPRPDRLHRPARGPGPPRRRRLPLVRDHRPRPRATTRTSRAS